MFQFPGFLHNLIKWTADHAEGMAKGDRTTAQIEASPIVAFAVQAGEDASKNALIGAIAPKLGVAPTAEGITGALTGLIDTATQVPSEAKEPLKLLLGGLLAGTNFLSAPAPAVPAPVLDPTPQQEGQTP